MNISVFQRTTKSATFLLLFMCLSFVAGCSTKTGNFITQSRFSYPNSNVTPLGHVEASITKTTFVINPSFDEQDARDLYEKALAQKPGADLLIDYKADTETTIICPIVIPPFCIITMTTTVSGTAAKMEIGRKAL